MKKSAVTIILAAAVTATSFAAVSAAEPEQEIMLIASAPYTLNVNGKTAGVKYEVYKENDKIMVPLRFVAENLGFKVEWNEENQAVRLDDGTVNTMVRIGDDSYYMASSTAIGMSAPTPLGAAPVIKGEFTYVPADMFNILCGKTTYTVKDNTVEFDLSAEDSTQIRNPFIEYKTVDDAKKALSFNAKIPAKLPGGYKLTYVSTLQNEMLQLVYEKEGKEIMYRTEKGSDDISGDYNVYKDVKTEDIGGREVTVKGDGTSANTAVWQDEKEAYSVYSQNGIAKEEIKKIVEGVK